MSATGSNTPANHFGGSFGPNEWLVDEMFEKYLADPNSVDAAWGEFFADYKPNANGTSSGASIPTLENAPKGGTPPLPKKMAATPVAPVAQATPVAPVAQATPVAPVAPAVKSATPADPIVKPIPTLVSPGASSLEPIRGVSARVVQSMEASLSVPTATSVRAIPAKLMI